MFLSYDQEWHKMDGLNSELVSLMMKNICNLTKNWFTRVFMYLDYYQTVRSRICMSKVKSKQHATLCRSFVAL